MEGLGVQDNINVTEKSILRPGAVHVMGISDSSDDDSFCSFPESDEELPNTPPIEAHVAPTDRVIKAATVAQVEAQVVRQLNEPMEEPSNKISYLRIKVVVTVIAVCLVLVAIVGAVLLRRNDGKTRRDVVSSTKVDPLWIEIGDIIAPTEADRLLFVEPTSPQAQAFGWLQNDPITLMPNRSTTTLIERYALALLYFSTSGPAWRDQYLHLTYQNACTWNGDSSEVIFGTLKSGVFCNSSDGTVSGIVLSDNNLNGTIPWELVLLSDLSTLTVDSNSIEGRIPLRITELTRLEVLKLGANYLTGP